MAMGIIALSAEFIKFAIEHRATIREDRGNIENLGILSSKYYLTACLQ